jgi:hypothetical protein
LPTRRYKNSCDSSRFFGTLRTQSFSRSAQSFFFVTNKYLINEKIKENEFAIQSTQENLNGSWPF